MDNKSEQRGLTIEATKNSMIEVFHSIGLEQWVPQREGGIRVGILGAGVAIEAKALDEYFKNKRERPHIEAFDVNDIPRVLTEQIAEPDDNFRYTIANIADPNTFEGKEFDLLIIRNPDVHTHPDSWETGLELAYKTLVPGGVIIATTTENREFLERQFKKLRASYTFLDIPKKNQIGPFFPEDSLYYAMKPKQK